jgi:hypothetical protein
MTDTQQFFQKAALWDVAPSPDQSGVAAPASSAQSNGGNGGRNTTLSSSGNPIDPLYLMMQLPGYHGQEFVLERPFVPRRKANQLSSFLIARSDPANYGQLVLYQTPEQSVAPSPARAASLIEADPTISKQFSLLDQLGSSVIRGDTQLVPVDNSIFYVRPIFVEGKNSYPRFNFVAVTYGERAVLDTSVTDAVSNLLAGTIPPAETLGGVGGTTSSSTTTTTTPTGGSTSTSTTLPLPPGSSAAQLIARANALYIAAYDALANQDLETYAADMKQVGQLLAQAAQLSSPSSTTTPRSTSSTTTTGPPRPKSTTTVAHA